MRKMKRFLAILLSAALLSPITAYADQAEEAKALYEQTTEKMNAITDMHAYYDLKMTMGGSLFEIAGQEPMDIRMEMDVRMNHITEPENMRYMAYTRMTMPPELGSAPVTQTMYYADGWCYMDMSESGQGKVRYPMAVGEMMKQTMASASAFDFEEDVLENFRMWPEGENTVVGCTVNDAKMNEYLQMVLSSTGMTGLADGFQLAVKDTQMEIVIDPDGNCIKERMKATMEMTMNTEGMEGMEEFNNQTITVAIDGDIGFADIGQPVDVPLPNPAEYTEMNLDANAAQ